MTSSNRANKLFRRYITFTSLKHSLDELIDEISAESYEKFMKYVDDVDKVLSNQSLTIKEAFDQLDEMFVEFHDNLIFKDAQHIQSKIPFELVRLQQKLKLSEHSTIADVLQRIESMPIKDRVSFG